MEREERRNRLALVEKEETRRGGQREKCQGESGRVTGGKVVSKQEGDRNSRLQVRGSERLCNKSKQEVEFSYGF